MDWLDVDLIKQIAGTSFAQQFTIWTTSLGIASWIHSGRVKKEMASQLSSITLAINSLASALKEELASHSERLELVTKEVSILKDRVKKIETP